MEILPLQAKAASEMVAFCKSPSKGVLNGSEQGTGKCVMTIEAIRQLPIKRTLIVCPAIVRLTWIAELTRWRTHKEPFNYHVCESMEDVLGIKQLWGSAEGDVPYFVAISYHLLAKIEVAVFMKRFKWDLLVLDECQAVKNIDSERSRTVYDILWPRATYHIALSGTPGTKNITDLFALSNQFAPENFPSYRKFCSKYSKMRWTAWGPKYYGLKNKEKLRTIIRSKFFIRYKKTEMDAQMPKKVWIRVPLSKAYAEPASIQDFEKFKAVAAEIKRTGKGVVPETSFAAAVREQGLRKVPAVVEYVDSVFDGGEDCVIVFAWHKDVIKELQKKLSKYKPIVIDGNTSPGKRQEIIDEFQDGKISCLILSIAACNSGITLHRSRYCVYAEFNYNPQMIAQSSDRIHRIGQKRTCYYAYFVPQGQNVDAAMVDAIAEKAQVFSDVLDN